MKQEVSAIPKDSMGYYTYFIKYKYDMYAPAALSTPEAI